MRESTEQKQAIRYLLGELSATERSAVEERFFADEDYSLFLDRTENDLIDAYARSELRRSQRRNFERHFLISARRRERVRLARILQTGAFGGNAALPAAPIFSLRRRLDEFFRVFGLGWAGAFAALVFVLLGGWWLAIRPPEDKQMALIENENQTPTTIAPPLPDAPPDKNPPIENKTRNRNGRRPTVGKDLLAADKPKSQISNPKSAIERRLPIFSEKHAAAKSNNLRPAPAATLLAPPQSAEKPSVVGTRRIENIRLRVVHNNMQDFTKYLVEIRASDGDLIWSREVAVSEKNRHKPLALDVRGGALASGSYNLTMSGATDDGRLEEINYYDFTVRKK